jgi:hypothetical protein
LEGTLITPSPEFFPFAPSYDDSYFEAVFENTKALMGLQKWPCTLERMDEDDDMDRSHQLEGEWNRQGAVGTFQITDQDVIIRYSSQQAQDPVALVATLAHELSHYLLATARTDPPGGWEDHELHTDIATVFSGFGIFQCNSAFTFQQWSDGLMQGWRTSRQGYLSESQLAYDLGIFATLHGLEPKPIARLLKPNPRSYFKKAIKDLIRRSPEINRLKSINGVR